MLTVDQLIEEYAEKLKKVYHLRSAGDYTFDGILSEFLRKVEEVQK